MGFKVTIRRNGAVCGEAHYKSEAVAAGIADKATKANPDVAAAVTRCNGAGCGCGVKANRRRRRNPDAIPMGDVKAALLAGGDGPLTDAARAPALRGVPFFTIIQAARELGRDGKVAFDGVSIRHLPPPRSLREQMEANEREAEALHLSLYGRPMPAYTAKQRRADERGMARMRRARNPLESITSSPRGQTVASRIRSALGSIPQLTVSKVSVSGMPGYEVAYVEVDYGAKGTFDRMSLPTKVEQALGVASHDVSLENDYGDGSYAFSIATEALKNPRRRRAARRRNGTTSANIAASRSLVHTAGLLRNGGARPTFAAVQKRIFNEFAAEGWTMSSPTLKVPHATSPDGKCRAWFKAQSIYFSRGGGKHELNTAHSATQNFDLRDVRPGAFVAWFEKNACAPYVHRTNGVRRRVARARVRRNSGSMTEAQASTLIRQLGGMGKLTAMIGASGFGRGTTDGHPSLTFKFKGSKKANVVTIILDPSDTYTVRFMRMAGPSKFYAVTPTGEASGVYADQLRAVFERHTGLYLSL